MGGGGGGEYRTLKFWDESTNVVAFYLLLCSSGRTNIL